MYTLFMLMTSTKFIDATGDRALVPILLALVFFAGFQPIIVRCTEHKLDGTISPDLYDITIKPYLRAEDGTKLFTFDGQVNITLHANKENVRNITLHTDNHTMIIHDILLYDATGNLLPNAVGNRYMESQFEKLTIELNTELQLSANYTLHLNYEGAIHTAFKGLHSVGYTDANGNINWIGITLSHPTNARAIVPCFDEPAMKAVFKMKINRHKTYNSVFNTRLLESTPEGDDRFVDHFEATPRMSSYLLAFAVSDFTARGNTTLSIIAKPDYYEKTAYSHSVAERLLPAYDAFYQLPYKELGNPIMQMLSTYEFPWSAMENWGLIIYKDRVLIQEPGYTDGWSNKQYTIAVISHEISHMWFGNSVTFTWWSYAWLNEGFARFYQYFFTNQIYPELHLDQQFVIDQVHFIFSIDATNSTQPLTSCEHLIETQPQILDKFGGITYSKGACIVRMLRNAMGHQHFDIAIRNYLQEFHLKNTVPADLFFHLKQNWPTEQAVNLNDLFYDWTEQVGFPVLKVNVATNRSVVTIEQERFLLDPLDGSDANLKYTIPITYADNSESNFNNLTPKFYMTNKENKSTLSFPMSLQWIIFNVQQTGFYRVFYDKSTLKNIKFALLQANHSGIHVINRAQLIDDLFNFAYADMLDYLDLFEFLEYMITETDYLPWYAALSGLTRIAQRTPLERQSDFGAFLTNITATAYEKLRFEAPNDTVLDVYNRNRIVKWACKYGNKMCEQDALAAHTAWLKSGIKPMPDFRETSYCSGNRVGNKRHFNDLFDVYKKENLTSEKEMILRTMGCTRNRNVILHYYALILSNEIPVEQKEPTLNALYAENPENVTPVFHIITDTIEELAGALESWSNAAKVIADIANYFTSHEQRNDLEKFINEKGYLFGNLKDTLVTALTNVDENLKWTENRLTKLFKYLESRNNAVTKSITLLLMLFMQFIYKIVA